ncbi:MAG TPA: ankyrin repeat domain-containing protein, partial [Solirubrobacteraceae bacterium]
MAALFWGHRETAELLAQRGGMRPRNLRVAAALGLVDIVEELVDPNGRPSPEAGAHRGFYRPHSGFPAWRSSDDPQEALDEALAWAARNDRADV